MSRSLSGHFGRSPLYPTVSLDGHVLPTLASLCPLRPIAGLSIPRYAQSGYLVQQCLCLLQPIFPPNPKRQKPVKELNLLNKPFCLEFFLRGHTGAREGEGLWELDIGTVQ
jgi:hypothetical protein